MYEVENLTQLILALDRVGCQVLTIQQRDESLESYYMNLVGGNGHA